MPPWHNDPFHLKSAKRRRRFGSVIQGMRQGIPKISRGRGEYIIAPQSVAQVITDHPLNSDHSHRSQENHPNATPKCSVPQGLSIHNTTYAAANPITQYTPFTSVVENVPTPLQIAEVRRQSATSVNEISNLSVFAFMTPKTRGLLDALFSRRADSFCMIPYEW